MQEKEKAINILMLMFALLKQIKPEEHTRRTNKLTVQVKKYLRNLFYSRRDQHDNLANNAEKIWEAAKVEILKEIGESEYTVSMTATLTALYGLLEHLGYQNIAFTHKTFEKALLSMQAVGYTRSEDQELQIETWSNMLIGMFADALDIKQDSRLKILKAKVAGNLLLSGKLKKEYTNA